MINLKSKEQIDIMYEANRIVHCVLDTVAKSIKPGISTETLDKLAEETVIKLKAIPAFKGYCGYPKSLCISINDEIVHGIPSDRIIKDKDVVSIDFGAIFNGFAGDAARTIIVGDVDEKIRRFVNNTKLSLLAAIDKMRVGNRLYDVSEVIDNIAKTNNYGNVKAFCGHGIGKKMHEEPKVLNYVNKKEANIRLQEGLVLAIEPMFTLGTDDVETLSDKWTVVTKDKSLAAHWEVSVAITNNGPKVLGKNIKEI